MKSKEEMQLVESKGADRVRNIVKESLPYLVIIIIVALIRTFLITPVRVDLKIKETDSKGVEKIRIQAFEGLVMQIKGSGVSKTFTVRKVSGNVGAEKTFPVNSPKIAGITVVRKGLARRAKLYYSRDLVGQFKLKERN